MKCERIVPVFSFVVLLAAIPVASGADYASAILEDSPLAYWRLGETTGALLAENEGTLGDTVDGTYSLGVQLDQPSLLANGEDLAAKFNGFDGMVTIPDHEQINTGGPYDARSVELWFVAETIDIVPGMLFEEGGATRGLSMYVQQFNEKDVLYLCGWNQNADEGYWGPTCVATEIEEGEIYHVVLVFVSSAPETAGTYGDFDGRITGHLDGVQFGTREGADQLYSHGNDTGIGAINENVRLHDDTTQGDGANFLGRIDEVAMYDYALDDPNGDGDTSDSRIPAHLAAASSPGGEITFKRGDANADGGVNIADAVCVLNYLFTGTAGACRDAASACLDAVDTNNDGNTNVADAVAILQHIFLATGPLPEPFQECGTDPPGDEIGCTAFPPCAAGP
jgi:hypothetical protein